jgi:membrane dipeptidase
MRAGFIIGSIVPKLTVCCAILAPVLFLTAADDTMDRARRLQSEVIGIDSHIDTMQRVLMEHADIGRRLPDGQADLVRLREGGMHAPFFALWVPMYYKGSEAVRRTLDFRDAFENLLERYPDQIELATTAADVERIVHSHKIAAVLTLEGGHQIADDLAVLRMYHRMGIRSMTLTHFRDNDWCDSSTDKPRHDGLTEFGKQVVREMNRIGIIVDISHVSDKAFYDALAVTTKPVIASHSSCRALSEFPRNMTDDMLRALARNGGVVGINFGGGFLNQKEADNDMRNINSISAEEPNFTGRALDDFMTNMHMKMDWRHPRKSMASLDDVVAHIDHVVKVAGIDHVGIGSDFDGISDAPRGLEDESKMPALTAALLQHGYSESDIRKIMGENTLRVMREVIGK